MSGLTVFRHFCLVDTGYKTVKKDSQKYTLHSPVLQIKRGNTDNLRVIFSINSGCDPSLEPAQRDGSYEESQHSY